MTSAPPPRPRRKIVLRVLLSVGALVAFAGVGYTVHGELQRAERDRHAVIEGVQELERLIRRHDGQLFVRLGVAPDADPAHQSEDRERILKDFELLSHVEGFRVNDLRVVVTGDSAEATYAIEGKLPPTELGAYSDQPATPQAGVIEFLRHGGRWEIVGHRFLPR